MELVDLENDYAFLTSTRLQLQHRTTLLSIIIQNNKKNATFFN